MSSPPYSPLLERQSDSVLIEHAALIQQAPVEAGGAHGEDVHNEPSPWYTPLFASQFDSVSVAHEPSTQHAPTVAGVAQGSPVQVLPSPKYTPASASHASIGESGIHVPIAQHAPLGNAQGSSLQVELSP